MTEDVLRVSVTLFKSAFKLNFTMAQVTASLCSFAGIISMFLPIVSVPGSGRFRSFSRFPTFSIFFSLRLFLVFRLLFVSLSSLHCVVCLFLFGGVFFLLGCFFFIFVFIFVFSLLFICLFFQHFSGKIHVLIWFFTFFHFHSLIRWKSKIQLLTSSFLLVN